MASSTSIVELLNLPIGRFNDIYEAIREIITERNKRKN